MDLAQDWDWDNENPIDTELDWDDPPENEPINSPATMPVPEVTQERATQLWIDFLTKYANDPVAFAEEVLGIELMRHQKRVLMSVANKKRRIAIKSGHRVGKTMLLAIISLWHLITKYPQKTIITAPTSGQLFNGLYAEIMILSRKLPDFIRDLFNFFSEEIKLKADPNGSFLAARTASPDNPESFQGIHSENVLFIFDEASGIHELLFNAARGSMAAPNAMQILAGNPTRLNNTFHRAFTINADLFDKHTVCSKGLKTVDNDFIKEIVDTFGEDSNEYKIRVLGEFPDTDDESYIPATAVKAARVRDISPAPLSAIVYGVDPARYGNDRTVITRRVGLHNLESQHVHVKKNTMQVVGEIVALADADRNKLIQEFKDAGRPLLYLPPVPAAVVVDVIGIGAGIVDRLIELGFNVIAVNVSENATSEPLCHRERDALYKRFRTWLETGKVKIPDDDQLAAELTAPLYQYDSSGVLKIESKKEMKKRVGRSPDKGDSAMLTLMVPPELITGYLSTITTGTVGYGSGPRGRLSRGSHAPTALRR